MHAGHWAGSLVFRLMGGSGGSRCSRLGSEPGDPRGARRGAIVAAMAMVLAGVGPAYAAQPQKFLTFDSHMTPAQIKANGSEYVYVWGASDPALNEAFQKNSPGTQLSAYYPYSRDPDAKRGLDYWKANHPSWIAYTCDGVTPVSLYGDSNVALDITNPDVIAWQVGNFLSRPAGVDTVAFDNFQFHNDGHMCGVRNASGRFVQSYVPKSYDMAYAQDRVRWLEQVAAQLHAHQVKVVVNHIPDLSPDGDDPSSPIVASMVRSVDGILDEHAQLALRDAGKSALLAKLVDYADSNGKWMYLLYQLDEISRSSVESAVANYLTMAGPKTAIYISRKDDAYGYEPDLKGFDKTVGGPCGPVVTMQGIVIRRYSGGLAIFAAPGSSSVSLPIPAVYTDVDGAAVAGTIHLEGGQGRVLYTRQGDNGGCKVALQMPSH